MKTLLILVALISGSAFAHQSYQLIDHDTCTEIRLAPFKKMAWHEGNPSGSADEIMLETLRVFEVTALYPLGNYYDHNDHTSVAIARLGHPVPAYDDTKPSIYANFWLSPKQGVNVGVVEVLSNGNPAAYDVQTGAPVPTDQYNYGSTIFVTNIYVATFYISKDPSDTNQILQTCSYVTNEKGLSRIEANKCVWMNSEARSASGKPFCFSGSASFRNNDLADQSLPQN